MLVKSPGCCYRFTVKRVLSAVGAVLGIFSWAEAEELPAALDQPFLGCWLAFSDSRDFEFLIGGDGDAELFFEKNRERLTVGGCSLKIYYTVGERVKGKGGKTRWSYRRIVEDGFEDFGKETAEPPKGKPVSFTATFTGGIKVRITHVFSKSGVEISTKILEKGESKGDLRAGVKILVGDLFRHIEDEDLEEKETEAKLEDTRISVFPAGARRAKRIKFEDYDTVLTEECPKGARAFELESDRYGGHEFQLTTVNPDFGLLEFVQQKRLIHGFFVNWFPEPTKVDEKDARLEIRVK